MLNKRKSARDYGSCSMTLQCQSKNNLNSDSMKTWWDKYAFLSWIYSIDLQHGKQSELKITSPFTWLCPLSWPTWFLSMSTGQKEHYDHSPHWNLHKAVSYFNPPLSCIYWCLFSLAWPVSHMFGGIYSSRLPNRLWANISQCQGSTQKYIIIHCPCQQRGHLIRKTSLSLMGFQNITKKKYKLSLGMYVLDRLTIVSKSFLL